MEEIVYASPVPKRKLKSYIEAVYTGRSHFHYSGQYPEKQELSIYMSGIFAKIFGFLFRAKQY